MIAVITGGRDVYPSFAYIEEALGVLKRDGVFPTDLVVRDGNCPTGVDQMVLLFCIARGINYKLYPAKWHLHGDAAGSIRNKEMLLGADICCVFPGGAGTRNCRSTAKTLKVPVNLPQTPAILAANRTLTVEKDG